MAETKVFCHNNIQLKNLLHKQVTFNFEPVEEEKKNPDQIEEEDAYSGTEESMCDDTQEEIKMTGFEYSQINYRGYDIASYINESMIEGLNYQKDKTPSFDGNP